MEINKKDIVSMVSDLLNISLDSIGEINENENLMNLGMSSISCIQLVVLLEDKYNFVLKDEDLLIEKLNTISKLVNIVERYLNV